MDDMVYRQQAIDELKRISFSHWFECGEYLSEDTREIEIINSSKALEVIEALPSAQPDLTYIIFETLAECGIYGEEATVKFIGTLKRLGRSDLLPPCAR